VKLLGSTGNLLHKLFQIHLESLRQLIPDAPEVFVCPICMNIFPESDLNPGPNGEQRKLTDGHVWNEKYVEQFANQNVRASILFERVLLCKPCNSSSGSPNESTLIEFEKFRKIKKSGGYGKVKAFAKSGRTKVDLKRMGIQVDKEGGYLYWKYPINPQTGRTLYDPKEKNQVENLIKESLRTEQPFQVFIEDTFPVDEKWQKAQTALITSAYLKLFHEFGYSYIFNASLEPVRKHILQSFEGRIDTDLTPSPEKHFSVGICGSEYRYPEPHIAINPPSTNRIQILEVNFMDYHMRLPFPADYIEDPELCEDSGKETGEIRKALILDAPDDEIIDSVREKLEAFR